jgi:hypothetical protein
MLAPSSKNVTSVPYSANLLSLQIAPKLLFPMLEGKDWSWRRGDECWYLHAQVWIVSISGVWRLSMCAQIVVMRVNKREGRIVHRERAARRVCFCLSWSYGVN